MIFLGVEAEHLVEVLASGLFKADWYLGQYQDVATAGVDPLEHFMLQGWTEGRSPSGSFDLVWYRGVYSAVIPNGMNPLIHFVTRGCLMGLKPSPELVDREC